MRTFVEISRAALAANYQAIRAAVGEQVEILAVVKADAYGHGAVRVAQTLEDAGARWFAVTSIDEGVELRRHGVGGRIVVLAECARSELNTIAEFNLTLMLHSIEDLRDLDAWARMRECSPRFHLKFDSGMGRLGLAEARAGDVAELLEACPHLRLEGLATHFASAEDLGAGQTEQQLRRFSHLVDQLAARGIRPAFVHAANSAALAYRPDTWGSMARPGLALYGYLMPPRGATAVARFQVQPVLTWKAQILTIKDMPAGVALGYNATFRTERPMRIGVVAAGYADGLDRRLSNGGFVLAAGARAPIVGLVSMDVCLVDLSASPGLRPGDYVTLLGREGDQTLDAAEIAEHCGTIPYEVLVRIGRRVTRVYR
jgi:alanine racemase